MRKLLSVAASGLLIAAISCEMNKPAPVATAPRKQVAAAGDTANYPPPGSSGNADNVKYLNTPSREDPSAPGQPVRLALRTGHVSNYTVEKIPPYTLPDPLVMFNGRKVRSADQWFKQRRPEILKYYQEQIYGKIPATAPKVTWTVAETDPNAQGGTATMKRVVGKLGESDRTISMTMYTPKSATGPVPLMLAFGFGGGGAGARGRGPATAPNRGAQAAAPTTAPGRGRGGPGGGGGGAMAQFLEAGWGYATISNGEIQPDNLQGLTAGVIGLSFAPGQTERKPDEWGSIAAWAWGLSRCVDYFETDPSVNAKQVSVTGASRLGKTALWACASDERIAGCASIVGGELGAALIRRDWGETLDDMAQNYPWQFAGNIQNWVGRWDELPVDQHMLIALCAPRLCYVNGGVADQWSDPVGEFLAIVAAGPVYKLLGLKDLGTTEVPPLDKPLISGGVGFLYHSLGHSASPLDYPAYREFAERHFKAGK